jgi:hypothetical protein
LCKYTCQFPSTFCNAHRNVLVEHYGHHPNLKDQFFKKLLKARRLKMKNHGFHLHVKSWKSPLSFWNIQLIHAPLVYEVFHHDEHICKNVRTPNNNCDANLKKFVIIFYKSLAFLSCKNLKIRHDLLLEANKTKKKVIGKKYCLLFTFLRLFGTIDSIRRKVDHGGQIVLWHDKENS